MVSYRPNSKPSRQNHYPHLTSRTVPSFFPLISLLRNPGSILALNLVLPLDESLSPCVVNLIFSPTARVGTYGVCNEESWCLINPVRSDTDGCSSNSRGVAAR